MRENGPLSLCRDFEFPATEQSSFAKARPAMAEDEEDEEAEEEEAASQA